MNAKRRYGYAALVIAGVLLCGRAHGVEVTIDDFNQATNTQVIAGVQLIADMVGETTTTTDTGLSGVVGGVRMLTVTATAIVGGGQNVTAGVDPGLDLCFNSTPDADGNLEALYDRGGLGLQNLNLSHAQGIQFSVLFADGSSTPYSVKLTLEDTSGNSASSEQTSSDSMCTGSPCTPFLFPFTDYGAVNLRRIASVKLFIDPNKAGDIFFGPIMTYGTPNTETICDDGEDNDNNGLTDCADPACVEALNCIETAPLLSSGMLGVMITLLSGVGLMGMARARRRPQGL